MEYTDEFIKKIIQCGTLGYPASKIINVLDITDEVKFYKEFDDSESIIYKSYKKGIDKSDFILDSKLFELAKKGDLKAIEKYEQRKKQQITDSEKEKTRRTFNKSL